MIVTIGHLRTHNGEPKRAYSQNFIMAGLTITYIRYSLFSLTADTQRCAETCLFSFSKEIIVCKSFYKQYISLKLPLFELINRFISSRKVGKVLIFLLFVILYILFNEYLSINLLFLFNLYLFFSWIPGCALRPQDDREKILSVNY